MDQTPAEYAYELVIEYWGITSCGGRAETTYYMAKACAKLCVNRIGNQLDDDEPDHQKLYSFLEEVLIEIDKL